MSAPADLRSDFQHDLRERARVLELARELSDVVEIGIWPGLPPDERERYVEMARVALRFAREGTR